MKVIAQALARQVTGTNHQSSESKWTHLFTNFILLLIPNISRPWIPVKHVSKAHLKLQPSTNPDLQQLTQWTLTRLTRWSPCRHSLCLLRKAPRKLTLGEVLSQGKSNICQKQRYQHRVCRGKHPRHTVPVHRWFLFGSSSVSGVSIALLVWNRLVGKQSWKPSPNGFRWQIIQRSAESFFKKDSGVIARADFSLPSKSLKSSTPGYALQQSHRHLLKGQDATSHLCQA